MKKLVDKINKINYKKVVIGFLLVAFILLLSLGIVSYLNVNKIKKNNSVAESITGKVLPVGFSAIEVSESGTSTERERVAFLMNRTGESIVLVEGPRLKLQRQRNEVIYNLQIALQKFSSKRYTNLVEIKEAKHFFVDDKMFPAYNITITHNKQITNGIAIFLDYRKKTLCVIYMANKPDFKLDTAIEFLNSIRLPGNVYY